MSGKIGGPILIACDRSRRADTAAGRHFEVARGHASLVIEKRRARVRDERSVDVRAAIHRVQHQANRKAQEHVDWAWRRQRRQPGVRNRLRQADVDVQPERCCNLVLKEVSEAAMLWIHSAQQLAFIKPEDNSVLFSSCGSHLPRRPFALTFIGTYREQREEGKIAPR